jgi:hypothetical protein
MRSVFRVSLFFCLAFIMACGGNTQNVTVTVLPASATLDAGRTLQFLATVTGASDNSVVWLASGRQEQ